MKKKTKKDRPTLAQWQPRAERELRAVLLKAWAFGPLRKRAPGPTWTADVRLVGALTMKRLNGRYRSKHYATDVLSFSTPAPFRAQGALGELIVCLPTLVRQARERGHAPAAELRILLAHGLLHLLGMDHEAGEGAAREMARWEQRLLPVRVRGLIGRSS